MPGGLGQQLGISRYTPQVAAGVGIARLDEPSHHEQARKQVVIGMRAFRRNPAVPIEKTDQAAQSFHDRLRCVMSPLPWSRCMWKSPEAGLDGRSTSSGWVLHPAAERL